MSNATDMPPAYAAQEGAPHLRAGYCYVVQMDDGTTLFLTGRDRTISIANLPAAMAAADPQTFSPAQISHGTVKSADRYEQQSTTIQVTTENLRLQRYMLTAGTVKLKAWIIRLARDTLDSAVVDFETEALVVQSGILGRFSMKGNVIGVELTPEPFYVEGKIPRFFYGRGCQHFLYGEQFRGVGCGVDKTAWQYVTTIASVDPAQRSIIISGQRPASAETFFNAGHLLITALNVKMTIAWSAFDASDTLLKLVTWHPEIEVGQALTAYGGCAHTRAACEAFGNLENFGGFSDVPNKSPLHGVA